MADIFADVSQSPALVRPRVASRPWCVRPASKPTLYAHFRSKFDLVAAVLEQRHLQRAAELRAWVEQTGDARQRPLAGIAWLADCTAETEHVAVPFSTRPPRSRP